MKVLFESASPCVTFFTLKPGEVFRRPGEEYVCMVCIHEDADPMDPHNNAVNLHTGEMYCFGNDVMVERLNAVLHIR